MRKRSTERPILWIIVFIFLGGFLMYLLFPNCISLARYKEEQKSLDFKIKELKKENEALKAEIERLKTDPFYIEKIAREELQMTRPGEIIYRITPESNKDK
jgi:cell division protein FtsB